MSELAKLVASPRSNVINGYILSPPAIPDHGEVETLFEKHHINRARRLARGAVPEVALQLLQKAMDDLKQGDFCIGSPYYDVEIKSAKRLPLLLLLCLRVKHPQLMLADATRLLREGNESAITEAVLDLWGFGLPTTSTSKKKTVGKGSRSRGKGASAPSVSEATPATISGK